jgi:membrane protein YqaA with SNARE-associated domain
MTFLNWPRHQIRRLYAWTVSWAETKHASRALGAIAFTESSFFPIPPDPLLVAMTTVRPRSYLKFATLCTLASVAGGLLGYAIGIGLFEAVGQRIIDLYGLHEQFDVIGDRYQQNAFLTIITAAFTPIPFKLITIAAGVFTVNIFEFVLAALVGRGARFYTVAFLMHHFGRRYKDKIERYVDILSIAFIVVLILGFVALRFVF